MTGRTAGARTTLDGHADGTPRGAGHALHDVLDRVRNSGQQNILGAWQTVLGDQATSIVWTQRHAEVVGLYQTLMHQVLSLPSGDPTQVRAMRYAPDWYRAIVWQSHWQANAESPSRIIDDERLDSLGFVADLLALRLPGTAAVPTDESMAHLRQEVAEWLALLDETDEIPRSVSSEISGQLQHVLWLLDNVDTFGADPIVRQTRETIGRLTETLASQGSPSGFTKTWTDRVGRLIVALTLFTGGLQAGNLALVQAEQTVTVISEIVRGVAGHSESPAGQPALPSGTGSEATASEPHSNDEG